MHRSVSGMVSFIRMEAKKKKRIGLLYIMGYI